MRNIITLFIVLTLLKSCSSIEETRGELEARAQVYSDDAFNNLLMAKGLNPKNSEIHKNWLSSKDEIIVCDSQKQTFYETKIMDDYKFLDGDQTYIGFCKLKDGFEFNGQRFKSLSAIANKITGTRWNGPKFFNLRREVNC